VPVVPEVPLEAVVVAPEPEPEPVLAVPLVALLPLVAPDEAPELPAVEVDAVLGPPAVVVAPPEALEENGPLVPVELEPAVALLAAPVEVPPAPRLPPEVPALPLEGALEVPMVVVAAAVPREVVPKPKPDEALELEGATPWGWVSRSQPSPASQRPSSAIRPIRCTADLLSRRRGWHGRARASSARRLADRPGGVRGRRRATQVGGAGGRA
jgi:hypothetical protein